MARKTTCVVTAAVFVALSLIPDPASAGGRIGFTVSPRGEEAEALRTGLQLYSIARSLNKKKHRARVDQRGQGNGAAIAQHGENNSAGIFQRGRGNSGSITQNGNDNAYALFQFGRKGNTSVSQNGNGNAGARFEWGW
ncbi:MAG: curlin [Hyphomicrobium sp.]